MGIDRSADVLLADGATVHLRQIRPADAPQLVAMHSRFSERTRYLRYFSPYPRIPDRDLRRFVEVDHRDREAFVAELGDRLIAVGQYERLGPDAPDAEVAFVVEDAHQGRGVGSTMLEHLAEAARESGISRFVAEVLPANGAMLRVFTDAGYQVQRRYADGVVHLDFRIAPTERSREVQQGREHRTEARSIARLLNPRGIAVYGARAAGTGVGAALLEHLRAGGFTGAVYPIHAGAERVCGLPAYPSAVDTPQPAELAVVAVPAPAVPAVVADAALAGAHGLVVVSAGFADTGPDGAAAQDAVVRAAHAAGMRVVGPNCLGVANNDPAVRLNATLAPRLPGPGRVGIFSQSGALGVALLAEAARRGLGMSSFVSAGNRADVSGNDLLQYWQDDPCTDVILLYLESFGNPRKFARLSRRVGRVKPIVAVSSASRPDRLLEPAAVGALFARSGVIRVETVAELLDVGVLLADQPLPGGERAAVVTNSWALGRLAATACAANGLTVPPGYPRDVGPQAEAEVFAAALAETAADPGVDALVVVVAPPLRGALAGSGPDFAEAVAAVGRAGEKPVVATVLFGVLPGESPVTGPNGGTGAAAGTVAAGTVADVAVGTVAAGAGAGAGGRAVGEASARVPAYPSVEEAVRALARVSAYAAWLRQPAGTVPVLPDVDPSVVTTEPVELLRAYGVPVVPFLPADSADAAVLAADRIGYPVVLKSAAPGLRHRLDLGAVRLDLESPRAVRRAYAEVSGVFGPAVLVQRLVPPGVACVVQMTEDPAFGPVIGFGLGGVATDLVADRAWRPVPLTDRDAASLVDEPRAAPLLRGYRGAQPVDRAALADLLLRVGRLVDEHPEVRRLSLHPVLARPDGLSVLHASVTFGEPTPRPDTGPRRLS